MSADEEEEDDAFVAGGGLFDGNLDNRGSLDTPASAAAATFPGDFFPVLIVALEGPEEMITTSSSSSSFTTLLAVTFLSATDFDADVGAAFTAGAALSFPVFKRRRSG